MPARKPFDVPIISGERVQSFFMLQDVMKVAEIPKGMLYGKTVSGMDAEGQWNPGGFVDTDGKVEVTFERSQVF